jgi:hypothetical protein
MRKPALIYLPQKYPRDVARLLELVMLLDNASRDLAKNYDENKIISIFEVFEA